MRVFEMHRSQPEEFEMRWFSPLLFVFFPLLVCAQQPDLNVILMENTFLVRGAAKKPVGGQTFGTAFLLLNPLAAQPVPGQTSGKAILVTAAHVFEEMDGDNAVIVLRSQVN